MSFKKCFKICFLISLGCFSITEARKVTVGTDGKWTYQKGEEIISRPVCGGVAKCALVVVKNEQLLCEDDEGTLKNSEKDYCLIGFKEKDPIKGSSQTYFVVSRQKDCKLKEGETLIRKLNQVVCESSIFENTRCAKDTKPKYMHDQRHIYLKDLPCDKDFKFTIFTFSDEKW